MYIFYIFLFSSPSLTWRDVQYLLVYSSNSAYFSDDHWQVNGAGLNVSHWYGFGIIDGAALVNRARNWVTVPPYNKCTLNLTSILGESEMATSDNSLVVNMHVENCRLSSLEHVQAITSIRIHDGKRKDISILLTSPAGTNALLLPFRVHDQHKDGFHLWPFMSVLSWGERPNGDWIFTIELKEGSRVELDALELLLYGTDVIPPSVQVIPSTCHSQCLKGCAKYGSQFCDSCKHFQIATSFECVETCPDGTYQNGDICHACPPHCTACSDSNSCTSCLPNTYLLSSGSCLSSCPTGTFATSNGVCSSCHQSCLACNGSLNTDCIACLSQFLLVNQTCVVRALISCSVGEYFDYRSHECLSCHVTCASCISSDYNQCSSCYSGATLSQNRMCIDILHIRSCNLGQYLNTSNFECNDCSYMCSNCSDNETCLSCHDGYFFTQGGHCVSTCPQNSTADVERRLCIENTCRHSCLNCSANKPTHCISCHGQLLVENQCVSACPSHFYQHATSCQKCHSSCKSCNGPLQDQCLSCSGRFLVNRTCVEDCPTGTFGTENHHSATRTCQKCPSHCAKCDSTLSCHHCQQGYTYYAPNRSCEKQCPDGYYSSEMICVPCKFPCSTCYGASLNCSSCSYGMALHTESGECRKCCNPDAIYLQCCDCGQNDRYCQFSAFTTTSAMMQSTNIYPVQLIAVAIVFLLFVVLVVIVVTKVLFRRNSHNQSHVRYHILSRETLDIENGSEKIIN